MLGLLIDAVPVKMNFHGFSSFLCSPNNRMNVRVNRSKNMPSARARDNRTDVRVFDYHDYTILICGVSTKISNNFSGLCSHLHKFMCRFVTL